MARTRVKLASGKLAFAAGIASARVGSGGVPVTISSVVGHVTLHGG
jgi:hypothetical protein